VTLTGPYNGASFNAPFGLATDTAGKLYVADLGNSRIVVFTPTGTFVKALSTTLGGQAYQPVGVCVSHAGIVGVGNRAYNNNSPAGNAEFFPANAANNSTPTGYANGLKPSEGYCAFDKAGNFYVDAGNASGGGEKIAYVARGHVNTAGQTLQDSGQGSASYWIGMYCQINGKAILSVGASVGNSTTEKIHNFKVGGPANGPLAFSTVSITTLTSYPATSDALYQLAPSSGTAAKIYDADYGDGAVLDAAIGGGPVSVYNNVSGTVGVATNPTGQY
jgi:hypothetical protein